MTRIKIYRNDFLLFPDKFTVDFTDCSEETKKYYGFSKSVTYKWLWWELKIYVT
jgi:hypothetical protein